MTTQELDNLIRNAESGDAERLVTACEHLLNDYIKFRIKNVILTCHTQLLKLNWVFIEKLDPDLLVSEPTIKERFIDIKSAPTVTKLKDLFQYVIRTIQNHQVDSEYLQKLSVIFNRFGALLPTILDCHFNEYAKEARVKRIVANYNIEPSFRAYTALIKDILNLTSELNESERANRYYSTILKDWSKIENSSEVESLKSRCKKLALLLSRENELRFAQTKYGADKGRVADIAGLGILYEQGIGVTKDDTIAKMLYMQAMNAGYKDAQVYLDNLNNRIQQQKEQKLEQLRIQCQHEIQKKDLELRLQEAQQRSHLEYLRLSEEKRHNEQLEDVEKQKIEVAREKLSQDKELEILKLDAAHEQQIREEAEREKQAEEKMIEVFIYYKLHTWNGKTLDNCNMIRKIHQSTYNGLITGGTQAVISFVKGQIGYMREGEYIIDAYMQKFNL